MKVSVEQVAELFARPLLDLVFEAAQVHRANHDAHEVQLCTLLSVKTGGCPEDCAYCPQAARYDTGLNKELLLQVDQVLQSAQRAKEAGSTRFCMGAAWREVQDGKGFDRVIQMVKGVRAMGLEVCTTLGMVTPEQAVRLKEAGVYAYNHNLDTSREHYDDIITTRTYDDRLNTLKAVSDAGISVCCGGIIGMGETNTDRVQLLWQLANLNPQPESVPINTLVQVPGTPLADEGQEKVDPLEWVRMIAVARILMPKAMVRLSAGRLDIPESAQAMAFMAGANSIFTGDKLLTTANPDFDFDKKLLDKLGLHGRKAYKTETDSDEQSAAAGSCGTKTGGACGCASAQAA
jgi:biotin synthase